jgi:hypothetical protein
MPSAHDRARLRRSLVQLSSLLMLTLLALGLVSLFSLWSTERLRADADHHEGLALQAVDAARASQVSFKIEVQSWKNILLRGGDAEAYEVSLAELGNAAADSNRRLEIVHEWASRRNDRKLLSELESLQKHLQQLNATYLGAMPLQPHILRDREEADRAVRGIDRPINKEHDDLIYRVTTLEAAERSARSEEARRRYNFQTQMIWIALSLSLFLVGALLLRMLRDPAIRG